MLLRAAVWWAASDAPLEWHGMLNLVFCLRHVWECCVCPAAAVQSTDHRCHCPYGSKQWHWLAYGCNLTSTLLLLSILQELASPINIADLVAAGRDTHLLLTSAA
jgi:hypothetical protein